MPTRAELKELEGQAALFAVGALPAAEARCIEQRLASGCPYCQVVVREFESVAAALPFAAPVMEPPVGLRNRLLERIGAPPLPKAPRAIGEGTLVRADDTEWTPSPVPGVQFRKLYGRKTILVKMAPKTEYPAHEHHAAEQCLVLEGSITSDGVTAYAGDFTYMPAGSSHHPLYTETGCTFLIAYT